jgi:predicted TIM-barrel fold metal-dependent hydrolase
MNKGTTPKAVQNRQIEQMLKEYPNELVQSMGWDTGDETEAAEAILEESISDDQKRINLSKALARSMRQIKGYQKLCMEVKPYA